MRKIELHLTDEQLSSLEEDELWPGRYLFLRQEILRAWERSIVDQLSKDNSGLALALVSENEFVREIASKYAQRK